MNQLLKMRTVGVIALSLGLWLAGCGTKVPLNDSVGVEDRSGQAVQGTGASNASTTTLPTGTSTATGRDVNSVDLTATNQQKSAGVIYFDFDSYAIKPQFQSLLETQAKQLTANRAAKISLEGHTDEAGGREYNLALGQKRAEAVRRALAFLGVQEQQMEAVSYGKEKPAVQGGGEAAGAQNRRVEISNR